MSNRRFDVFLSYNSRDRPAVERLAGRPREQRLSCWLDQRELTPGRAWHEEIAEAIESARAERTGSGRGIADRHSRLLLRRRPVSLNP
ncbi:MAG: toll/interleukin-1 receptor domain-containing protein [Actinomycetota bacterium]|nr:toll/interleukin-1 receptor domain-containing protein [Actinomycetota bacterium]